MGVLRVSLVDFNLAVKQLQRWSIPRLSDVPGLLEHLGWLFAYGWQARDAAPKSLALVAVQFWQGAVLDFSLNVATSAVNSTTCSTWCCDYNDYRSLHVCIRMYMYVMCIYNTYIYIYIYIWLKCMYVCMCVRT